MKIVCNTLLAALVVMVLSCEKVIEIDLEDSEFQVIIEAKLQEGNHPFQVVISKSASYFDSAPAIKVEDANVLLKDDEGNTFEIPHVGEGQYVQLIEAIAGRTYTLEVTIETQVYQAISFLPELIDLVELNSEYEAGGGPIDEGYTLTLRFNDPADETNYYRFLHTLNDVVQKESDDLLVTDDFLFNGGFTNLQLFRQSFDLGDRIIVELIHFDEASYDYFNSLSDILSQGGGPGGGSAAPGNPNTNWSGNALGYFSAYSSDTMEILIEE